MMSHILLIIRIPAKSRDPSAVAKNLYYEWSYIEDFGCRGERVLCKTPEVRLEDVGYVLGLFLVLLISFGAKDSQELGNVFLFVH